MTNNRTFHFSQMEKKALLEEIKNNILDNKAFWGNQTRIHRLPTSLEKIARLLRRTPLTEESEAKILAIIHNKNQKNIYKNLYIKDLYSAIEIVIAPKEKPEETLEETKERNQRDFNEFMGRIDLDQKDYLNEKNKKLEKLDTELSSTLGINMRNEKPNPEKEKRKQRENFDIFMGRTYFSDVKEHFNSYMNPDPDNKKNDAEKEVAKEKAMQNLLNFLPQLYDYVKRSTQIINDLKNNTEDIPKDSLFRNRQIQNEVATFLQFLEKDVFPTVLKYTGGTKEELLAKLEVGIKEFNKAKEILIKNPEMEQSKAFDMAKKMVQEETLQQEQNNASKHKM